LLRPAARWVATDRRVVCPRRACAASASRQRRRHAAVSVMPSLRITITSPRDHRRTTVLIDAAALDDSQLARGEHSSRSDVLRLRHAPRRALDGRDHNRCVRPRPSTLSPPARLNATLHLFLHTCEIQSPWL
jgi:hypothetical protein